LLVNEDCDPPDCSKHRWLKNNHASPSDRVRLGAVAMPNIACRIPFSGRNRRSGQMTQQSADAEFTLMTERRSGFFDSGSPTVALP
jgi:hypothetical protein